MFQGTKKHQTGATNHDNLTILKSRLKTKMRKDTFAELKFISIFPNDKHMKDNYVLIQIGHSDMIYFCCPKVWHLASLL